MINRISTRGSHLNYVIFVYEEIACSHVCVSELRQHCIILFANDSDNEEKYLKENYII
jgi:hypothetical protein